MNALEAACVLRDAGVLDAAWFPGMLVKLTNAENGAWSMFRVADGMEPFPSDTVRARGDFVLDDPATVGGLLWMFQSATGDEGAYVGPSGTVSVGTGPIWIAQRKADQAVSVDPRMTPASAWLGRSMGQALASALSFFATAELKQQERDRARGVRR